MDSSLTTLTACSVAAIGLISVLQNRRRIPAGHSLPPGPSPIPIIGNVMGVDPAEPWVSYTQWAKTYGDVVYTRLLNQEFVFLNTEEAARDLLERRSYNYSDRPAIMSMANDFFGWSFNSVQAPYGDRWRLHRRIFHQAFRPQAIAKYQPLQIQKAHDLLLNLLETPEDYAAHLQTHSSAIIMPVVYGYEPARKDDPLVDVVEKAVKLGTVTIRAEVAIFLGFMPFMRHIPPWFPGASFKRDALVSRKLATEMVEAPFRYVEESMEAGTAAPSMVSDSLTRIRQEDASKESVHAIKESSATVFAAASETTSSTLMVFLLAMVLNPDIQARAQAEIDSVVGTGRLPGFEDRSSLPYVEAILRETLRWHPVVPIGVPHATIDTDVYNGYFIPRGAAVITNTWAMSRNEAKYPDPERFNPERFLLKNGELNDDTVAYAFGAGRRICVGRWLAEASMWSALVSILALFKISPPKDEKGNDIPVEPRWTVGITSHPVPFPCRFVPRSDGLTAEKLAQMF